MHQLKFCCQFGNLEALNVCSGANRHAVATVTTAPNHIPRGNLRKSVLRNCRATYTKRLWNQQKRFCYNRMST